MEEAWWEQLGSNRLLGQVLQGHVQCSVWGVLQQHASTPQTSNMVAQWASASGLVGRTASRFRVQRAVRGPTPLQEHALDHSAQGAASTSPVLPGGLNNGSSWNSTSAAEGVLKVGGREAPVEEGPAPLLIPPGPALLLLLLGLVAPWGWLTPALLLWLA